MNVQELRKDYNWKEAFKCAGAEIKDVSEVLATEDGENNIDDWLGMFGMCDGTVIVLSAGCDYTGWDCQADGRFAIYPNVKAAIQGMGDEDRSRLKLKMVY